MLDKNRVKILGGVQDEELNLGEALARADMSRWGKSGPSYGLNTSVKKVSTSPDTNNIDAHNIPTTGPKTSPKNTYGVETATQEGQRLTGSAGDESTSANSRKQ